MIERFVEPYDAKDIDGLVALYAPDAEVIFFAFPPARGLEQIRALWEVDFRAFPETDLAITKQFSDGSFDMVEWTWTGVNAGPLEMPTGATVAPTGKKVSVSGMDAVEFAEDHITRHRLYFQEASLLAQLGLLPSS
jgi:predicted ester cyclase